MGLFCIGSDPASVIHAESVLPCITSHAASEDRIEVLRNDSIATVVPTLAYFLGVSQAPDSLGSPWFFHVLFATRALLFAPYLVLAPSSQLSWRTSLGRSKARGTLNHAYGIAWKMIAAGAVVLHLKQTKLLLDDNHKSAVWEGFRIINFNPATSALAYDYIIGVASLYIFWATY